MTATETVVFPDDEPVFSLAGGVSTESVSPEIYLLSRKNNKQILHALAETKQCEVARQMGIHETGVSRIVTNGTVERFARMLAILGMKVVPADAVIFIKFED